MHFTILQCPVILCEYFNIHVDDSDDSTNVQLLKSYDCIQHVTGSTHSHGHTLDLVISNTENILLTILLFMDYCQTTHLLLLTSISASHFTRLYGLKYVNGKSCQRLRLSQI